MSMVFIPNGDRHLIKPEPAPPGRLDKELTLACQAPQSSTHRFGTLIESDFLPPGVRVMYLVAPTNVKFLVDNITYILVKDENVLGRFAEVDESYMTATCCGSGGCCGDI